MKHIHEYLKDQMLTTRLDSYDIFTNMLPPVKKEILSPQLDRDYIVHAKQHYV